MKLSEWYFSNLLATNMKLKSRYIRIQLSRTYRLFANDIAGIDKICTILIQL